MDYSSCPYCGSEKYKVLSEREIEYHVPSPHEPTTRLVLQCRKCNHVYLANKSYVDIGKDPPDILLTILSIIFTGIVAIIVITFIAYIIIRMGL